MPDNPFESLLEMAKPLAEQIGLGDVLNGLTGQDGDDQSTEEPADGQTEKGPEDESEGEEQSEDEEPEGDDEPANDEDEPEG